MYIDYEWVKTYLKAPPSLEEACDLINSTGLEAEIDGQGLEIEHTVNRPDAMCHFGIARELAIKAGLEVIIPASFEEDIPQLQGWTISSDDAMLCPQYMGLLIENVAAVTSPPWLKARLEAIEQTSHNLLVDLTNFLLWEYSHPSHAFDADKLSGNLIRVRRGMKGERLKTLDGRDHDAEGLLCITDAAGPVALAGVMGGQNSEVDQNTTRLLLELAVFDGATSRRSGRATNIHSDARHRFERGVDRENMMGVIRRFIYLLNQEQPQARVVGLLDMDLDPFKRPSIELRRSRLDRLLGIVLSQEEVGRMLTGMDMRPEETANGWKVSVPGYKVDVKREVDVIEELIRFAGLGRLNSTLPALRGSDYRPEPLLRHIDAIRDSLSAMGLQEAISFSFTTEVWNSAIPKDEEPKRLRNPMSNKQAVMRQSILPQLLGAIRHNVSRGIPELALFEVGHVFQDSGEPHHLAVVMSFGKTQNHWWGDQQGHPFYHIKGIYERLAQEQGWPTELKPQGPSWLQQGEAPGDLRK